MRVCVCSMLIRQKSPMRRRIRRTELRERERKGTKRNSNYENDRLDFVENIQRILLTLLLVVCVVRHHYIEHRVFDIRTMTMTRRAIEFNCIYRATIYEQQNIFHNKSRRDRTAHTKKKDDTFSYWFNDRSTYVKINNQMYIRRHFETKRFRSRTILPTTHLIQLNSSVLWYSYDP
jgi:hypothetical protein